MFLLLLLAVSMQESGGLLLRALLGHISTGQTGTSCHAFLTCIFLYFWITLWYSTIWSLEYSSFQSLGFKTCMYIAFSWCLVFSKLFSLKHCFFPSTSGMRHVSYVLLGRSHESQSSIGSWGINLSVFPRSLVLGHVPGNNSFIIK